jgi:hypothetical protein
LQQFRRPQTSLGAFLATVTGSIPVAGGVSLRILKAATGSAWSRDGLNLIA